MGVILVHKSLQLKNVLSHLCVATELNMVLLSICLNEILLWLRAVAIEYFTENSID